MRPDHWADGHRQKNAPPAVHEAFTHAVDNRVIDIKLPYFGFDLVTRYLKTDYPHHSTTGQFPCGICSCRPRVTCGTAGITD